MIIWDNDNSIPFKDMINQVICGDCIGVMKHIPNKSVDLILTDPPYNAKNIGPNKREYKGQQMQLPLYEYIQFCEEWFSEAQRISKCMVFTPGISNMCYYPQPYWVLCWHKPAAISFNRMGGFNTWEPIFVYGKAKERLGQDYILFNTLNLAKGPERNHPCPKPPDLWTWLLLKFTKEDDLVLDIFNGSATTSLVCKKNGRMFIGIDHIQLYCEIAERRLAQDYLF